jgi:hypothetical protein
MRVRVSVIVIAATAALACAVPALGTHNSDEHSDNMSLVGNFNDDGKYRQGSDLAFWGNLAVAGNYDNPGGFRLFDITDPANLTLVGQLECPGPQNDVSIWGDLVFVSVDSPRAGPECGAEAAGRDQAAAGMAWEGIRVVSIANRAAPVQLAAVKTDCGSHTHTLYPDEANNRVLIYVQSYPLNPQGSDCNPGSHRKVSVVEVPLSNPAAAKVASTFDVSPAIGCHDSTVLVPRKIVGAACITESQLWDVSDPANPKVIGRIRNPAINIQHSTTFSWDGQTLVIGDELGGAEFTPGCGPGGDHVPLGALWFYDVSDPANPTPKANWRIPRTVPTAFCSAHNFNTVPVTNGKSILVSAWYNGGTTVVDFTDPTTPQELGFYTAKEPVQAATWSSYWYNDRIYGNNFDVDVNSLTPNSRGFDAMAISHPLVAGALKVSRLNPQTMEGFPNGPGVESSGLVSPPPPAACTDRIKPKSRFRRGTTKVTRQGLMLRGSASDRGCGRKGRGRVEQVLMSVARREGRKTGRCRFLEASEHDPKPHLGAAKSCRTPRPYYARARGTNRWRFKVSVKLPAGTYTIRSRALDSAANLERKVRRAGRARNFITAKVR